MKRLDCSVVVQVQVTEKVWHSNECSSGLYLLNCWTFCNQTWYGDATSWVKVPCTRIGLLSGSSGSQWGLIWSNMTVSTLSAKLLIFLQPNLIGCYIIISWSALSKLDCCFLGQITMKVQNLIESLCIVSSVPLISKWQPKKMCWFTIRNNQTKYNKVGIYWQ